MHRSILRAWRICSLCVRNCCWTGNGPPLHELVDRLRRFWLADEVVLYIGLASRSVRTRVGQYYKTPLGARKPHAGGWWLKTLSVLDELWVHFAATPDFSTAEESALRCMGQRRLVAVAWRAARSRARRAVREPAHRLRGNQGPWHHRRDGRPRRRPRMRRARPAATRSTVRPHAAKPAARAEAARGRADGFSTGDRARRVGRPGALPADGQATVPARASPRRRGTARARDARTLGPTCGTGPRALRGAGLRTRQARWCRDRR